jgi:uridine kinase
VGICGGSCSGKTSVARALLERLEHSAARLCFDSYYRPLGHMSKARRDRQNFDHPDSLDHELFIEQLDALAGGRAVWEPVYDFANHDRLERSRRVEPAPVVLVDGILLMAWPEIVGRLDLSIFVDASEEMRLSRRIVRDVRERGRDEESVRRQFAETVAPMHARYVQPASAIADRVVDGDADLERLADSLALELRERLPG